MNIATIFALVVAPFFAGAGSGAGSAEPQGTPSGGPPASPVRETRMAGRPPMGPLSREDPRVYDFTFRANVFTEIPVADATRRGRFRLVDSPIVMPFIPRSTWSVADTATFDGRLWLDGAEDRVSPTNARVELDKAFGMGFAIMPIAEFTGQAFTWEMGYRVQVWSSRIDDRAAGRIAWPQEWPSEVRESLRPQAWIDPDHPTFQRFVEQTSGGRLRDVPPYFAAKDLIRAAIDSFRVTANGNVRREAGAYVGMEVSLASDAALRGFGTAHDQVSICVAVLRAAGIPARPVVGVERDPVSVPATGLITWAEFFLPEAGWVPFDPMRMRNAALGPRHVSDPWPGLGTIRELNQRIPLSYTYHPPASVIAHEFPGVWGWDPRPTGTPVTTRQLLTFTTRNRGRGQEDPR